MLTVFVSTPGESTRELEFSGLPLRIGRHRDCEVRLGGWRVAPVHARLQQSPSGLRIVDAGTLQGFRVNGERGPEFPLADENDEIEIAGYRLRIRQTSVHRDATPPGLGGVSSQGGLREPIAPVVVAGVAGVPMPSESHLVLRRRLHQLLLRSLDLRRVEVREMASRELRERAAAILLELIPAEFGREMESIEVASLVDEVLDEALGLGPVERLLLDPDISEIMINGAQQIFVERAGRIETSGASFSSESALRNMVDRVVAPLGRRVDENSPMVDARLPDGSRLNAVLAPIAVRGTAVTIRRFTRRTLGPGDLVKAGSASEAMIDYLRQAVLHRRNVLISGGTGSGKTTLLNLLSGFIPLHERLITIEDAAELQLRHPHLISLEARPSNIEGRGAISIRELLRNALRMRPDRIIVGECRGSEALDMLQAMNTGHEGSLTTVHANSARDALARIETMVMLAGMDLPLAAVREQIASSVHVVVQQSRDAGGGRRITEISEVAGIEGSRILMQTLFRWSNGRFDTLGVLPLLNEVIERHARSTTVPGSLGGGNA